MITKWATSIANKLAELSGEDVSADQLEIYIYGLECFLNTFITIVLLFVWGVLSHTLGYTLIYFICFDKYNTRSSSLQQSRYGSQI